MFQKIIALYQNTHDIENEDSVPVYVAQWLDMWLVMAYEENGISVVVS